MKFCIECKKRISDERLLILPNTVLCVRCSNEKPIRLNQQELDGIPSVESISFIKE